MNKTRNELKKLMTAVLVATVCVLVALLCAAAPATTEYSYKAVIGFSLYAETDYASEVLVVVPQNATIQPMGDPISVDGAEWRKVRALLRTP